MLKSQLIYFSYNLKLFIFKNLFQDSVKKVGIQNFNNHFYIKDKCGTVVKELTIRGTDGVLYSYDILTGKNIESEERIFQLFHIANNYLLNYKVQQFI